jgi:uncharacterized membrane protein
VSVLHDSVFVPALRSRLIGVRTIAIELPAAAQPSERLHVQGSVDAVACAFIPAVAGIAASEWTEWVGAVSGAAIGAMAGQRVRRARIVHGAKSDKWTPELCPGTSGSVGHPRRHRRKEYS